MKNPTTFKPTGMSMPAVTTHSMRVPDSDISPAKPEQMTPWSHSGHVGKSGHSGMGAPYKTAADRTEMVGPVGMPQATPHSMPMPPRMVKKQK